MLCLRWDLLRISVFAFCVRSCVCGSNSTTSGGHDIWTYLFAPGTYNRDIRPVKQWTTTTVVNVSVAVIAIIEFDEVKQTMILTAKLAFTWTDEYLVWEPDDFHNISHIHIRQAHIWKPFVVLENSVKRPTDLGTPSLEVVVHSDGTVEWTPVEVFHTTCATDVRQFPFDTQKCGMVFEALGYKGSELRIQSHHDRLYFHEYGGTTGWAVINTHMEAVADGHDDIHLFCSITLKRNPIYFILNIFLPIVLLSLMNICVFLLPVKSGEKASFVITVFLALAVFLTIVSGNLPENSDSVSLLNIYVVLNTFLSVLIAVVTIIQIRLYHRDENMPVSKLLDTLTKMCTSKHHKVEEEHGRPTTTSKHIAESSNENQWSISSNTRNGHIAECSHEIRASVSRDTRNGSVQTVSGIVMDEMEHGQKLGSMAGVNSVTWGLVVKALDNIFFVLFLIMNTSITAAIFILAISDQEAYSTQHS